jgi:curved DNA-binding protein CbpA
MGGAREFEETAAQGLDPYLAGQNPGELTHYALLGVSVSASAIEIRRAYHELSLLYHPDTTRLPSAIATRRFQVLNEAYAQLSNPERRLYYDRSIGYSSVLVVRSMPSLRQEFRQEKQTQGQPQRQPHTKFDPQFGAYLDPEDRPLSSGEQFALFLMGITFVGCLGLAIFLSRVQS